MRQAGRYLPEYLEIKAKSSFLEMTRTPDIAAEITLQPLRRFPLDAAIIFSDIMTPLEALGIDIEFSPGPSIAHPLRSLAQVEALALRDEIAPFVGDALRIVKAALPDDVALIGFGGTPLTLAAYLIEGGGSKEYARFRQMLRRDPAVVHLLLEKLTGSRSPTCACRVAAGADAIQLFDSWAGLHDEPTYREFGLPYYKRIMDGIADAGAARMFFALGASHLMGAIAEIPCEVVSVDWRTDLALARKLLAGTRAARQSRSGHALCGARRARRGSEAHPSSGARRCAHLQPRARHLAEHADRCGRAPGRHRAPKRR
jgi:uroporphyrinogen decarboxylase